LRLVRTAELDDNRRAKRRKFVVHITLGAMSESLYAYAAVTAFVLCWLGGVVSWFFAAYYSFKASRRFSSQSPLARFNPFSFLMPKCFTDEGNYYRVRSLWAMSAFLVSCGGIWLISGMASGS
jgi:hypothetical protein